MSTALAKLTTNMAARFSLDASNGQELMTTLKATAFKGQVTDAQMTALMLVAQQYQLNPWTREIYAFPDKSNGIVPVVGVDGWSRIINDHPQFDGLDFDQNDESCTCIIFRKDRSHPVKVTEWMSECKRPNVGPWQTHPKRMLRHKSLIQAARLAFGFSGIYDQDEAERIINNEVDKAPSPSAPIQTLDEVLEKIQTSDSDVFDWIDAKQFTQDEKAIIRSATTKRRKELKEAIVADIPKAEKPTWKQMIQDAASTEELNAIWQSVPESEKEGLQDEYETKLDLMR